MKTQPRSIGFILAFLLTSFSVMPAFAYLTASPSYVSFGTVDVGSSSSRIVWITNQGRERAQFVRVTGLCPGDIYTSDSCFGDLNPGQSCTINVRFQPRRAGSQSCTVRATAMGGADTAYVNISGTGRERPR